MTTHEIRWSGPGRQPTRSHHDDAGFDLYCHIDRPAPYRPDTMVIEPGAFVDVPVGVFIELPPGLWALIKPRSSTLRQRGLLIVDGVIDTGYRGELFVGCWNLGRREAYVQHGDRLAQLIPLPNIATRCELTQVDELRPSVRGTAGFGSSGR